MNELGMGSVVATDQLVGFRIFRENLQETPIMGKSGWFPVDFPFLSSH